MTDYKQLCTELLDWLNFYNLSCNTDASTEQRNKSVACADKARAALAEPEPEGPVVWTEGICGDGAALLRDGVMVPIEEVVQELNQGSWARAVLARWGRSASQPEPEGPTDEELLDTATVALSVSDIEPDEIKAETELYLYGSEVVKVARAVLARWGQPS